MNTRLPVTPSIEGLSPFRHSREHPDPVAAHIEGAVPDWLRGEVVRTCPAIFNTQGWRAHHWFDGLGMLYAFRIGAGGIDFRSRLLDSEAARDAWQGKSRLATFGTPTERPLWQRIVAPLPRVSDNNNVNITRMGSALVAMTEGNRQALIDGATLASAGPVPYPEDALKGAIMTAHPHYDSTRTRVLNVATSFGRTGTISLYEHAPGDWQRRVIGAWRTAHVPYVHTFGLTASSAILLAHPFTATPIDMLWSNKAYIDHFDWRAREGTRLVVIDRATGAVREHVTDPFFVFHTVNAFERGDALVLDVLAYPDDAIVDAMRVERMAVELPDLRPALMRIVMRPGVERAVTEKLSDSGFEFPSINYRRVSGRPYRYAYGAANGPDGGPDTGAKAGHAYPSAVVKVDLETGAVASYSDSAHGFGHRRAHVFGEPLFVARPGGIAEDDGVLLTVGSARDDESAMLAVIDAASMRLLAGATVPSAVPLGFHGSFMTH